MCLISLRRKTPDGRVYETDYKIEWIGIDKIKLSEIGGNTSRTYRLYRNLKGFYIQSCKLKTYISSSISDYLSLFR